MQLNPSKSSSDDDGSASRVFKRRDLPTSPDISPRSQARGSPSRKPEPRPLAPLEAYAMGTAACGNENVK